jgi:hypothetical protein
LVLDLLPDPIDARLVERSACEGPQPRIECRPAYDDGIAELDPGRITR